MASPTDPTLHAFLRAAAVAFGLDPNAPAPARKCATRTDVKLIDERGRPRLRVSADGPFSMLSQPPGRYTLLVRRNGLTRVDRLDSPHHPLTRLVIANR